MSEASRDLSILPRGRGRGVIRNRSVPDRRSADIGSAHLLQPLFPPTVTRLLRLESQEALAAEDLEQERPALLCSVIHSTSPGGNGLGELPIKARVSKSSSGPTSRRSQ